MKVYELIDPYTIQQLNKLSRSVAKTTTSCERKSSNESLSKQELHALMGVNRQTYTRRNGAIRSK